MKKLYQNGTIYTMEKPDDTYAGVIVDNGMIEACFITKRFKPTSNNGL
ncbi:hypothetical protein NIT60_07800 [Mammaliicoccus sciuri]|nr:hypothetical protein NIT60_07800 [Mammaliicoccus sciuri]